MSEYATLLQLIAGQIDASWFMDVLVLIVIGIIGFLFKDIKTDIKEIKTVQHTQDVRMARMETKLKIEDGDER